MSAHDPRFPPIEPGDRGLLEVGGGHRIYWETCGNPAGLPALFLHGGPGSGASEGQRRLFDPRLFRAILFDQRGTGRSRPLADEPAAELGSNTTPHLVADIEVLRRLLGVERWVVLGLSWGSTLGLAYAQTHPERVAGLVLGLVATGSRREIDWITVDVGRLFPREWRRFTGAIPHPLRHLRPVEAYAALLRDPDPAVHEPAAREWCAWEDAHVSLAPGRRPNTRYDDPSYRLRLARLVTHYWSNDCFLGEDQLLRGAPLLEGIPGVLIQGRYDVSSPMEIPFLLTERWGSSSLQVLTDSGHGGEDLPGAVIAALAQVAAAGAAPRPPSGSGITGSIRARRSGPRGGA